MKEDHLLSYSLTMAQRLMERNSEGLPRTGACNYDFGVPMHLQVMALSRDAITPLNILLLERAVLSWKHYIGIM